MPPLPRGERAAEVPVVPPVEPEVVRAERAADAEVVATQDLPRRGSFWWMAGVILAVLL